MNTDQKQKIFDNIDQYTPEELAKKVMDGVVTFDELCKETQGYFKANDRKKVQDLLIHAEDNLWEEGKRNRSEELLARYIDIYENGIHQVEAKSLLKEIQRESEKAKNETIWNQVEKTNLSALADFIKNNPGNPHIIEAKRFLYEKNKYASFNLEEEIRNIELREDIVNYQLKIYEVVSGAIDNRRINLDDLLQYIKTDNNLLSSWCIKRLLENGYLDSDDLEKIGIDRQFIKQLITDRQVYQYSSVRELKKIGKPSTEVYFWGIPSSGKSCVLTALLGVARQGKVVYAMKKDRYCQGYDYMTYLSELLNPEGDQVSLMPAGNALSETYEMGFDLMTSGASGNRRYPITFIDMPGELLRIIADKNAGKEITESEGKILKTMTDILIDNRTGNRKIHFFVLEYGAENKKYAGRSQETYLENVLSYIEGSGKDIFKKDTNVIYLILTKVDKAGVTGHELLKKLKAYIEKYYRGFYQGLKVICSPEVDDINDGKVEVLPFSMGKVCFKDFCLFKEANAEGVLKKILDHSDFVQGGFGRNLMRKLLGL